MRTIARHIRAVSHITAMTLALAMATFALDSAKADTVSGSIAYDRLNLTTPDAALRTFLSAYRDGDFVTVFWIFSPSTQTEWFRRLAQFRIDTLVKGFDFKDTALMADLVPPLKEIDQTDFGFAFAHMMVTAKRRGMLPLDVTGLPVDLSPQNVPLLGKVTATTPVEVDIAVALKNYTGPVIFRMQLARSGRWRLLQIIPPGGDEQSIPFGLRGK
jgi:hypothetical protein